MCQDVLAAFVKWAIPHSNPILWSIGIVLFLMVVVAVAVAVRSSRRKTVRNTPPQPRIIKYVGKRGCEWKKRQIRENIHRLEHSPRIGGDFLFQGVRVFYPSKHRMIRGADDDAYFYD